MNSPYIYYKNDCGELWHGDCLEVMDILGTVGPIADMVLCDPPYGTTRNKWDAVVPIEKMWPKIWACTKSNAAVVLTAAEPFTSVLVVSVEREFRYRWTWDKMNRVGGHLNAKKQPLRVTEDALVFYRHQPTYNPQMREGKPYTAISKGRKSDNYGSQSDGVVTINTGEYYPKDLISIPADERGTVGRIHPTQKPVALFSYLIHTYTNPSDVVLDFCAGSGTTAVSAEMTGRKWVCIEKEEKYCEVAANRISGLTN